MKKITGIVLGVLLSVTAVIAQNPFGGKPIYNILTTELGDTLGTIQVELFPTIAPNHVANFDSIVNAPGSYDSCAFHRVVPGFVIQGGDPNSKTGPESTWGFGDTAQATVNEEFNPVSHLRGILSAARSTDVNSATSQFFICVANATQLDLNYTVYGNTISGMDVVDTIVNRPRNTSDRPLDKIEMFIDFVGIDSTEPVFAPTLASPADGTTDVYGATKFTWNKASGSDFLTYKIQFSQQSDFTTIDYEEEVDTSSNSHFADGLEQGYITYYWRVCTNNGGNINCSASQTIETFVGVPELVFPTPDLYPTSTTPTLTWNSVSGADGYHVQVSKNSNFAISIQRILDTTITDTSFLMEQLNTNTKYYWRVASVANGGSEIGDYSESRSFITTGNTGFTRNVETTNPVIVFPNPTTGKCTFTFDHSIISGSYHLSVYNVKGALVYSQQVKISTGKELPVEFNLPNGQYVYKLTNGSKTFKDKLIIR